MAVMRRVRHGRGPALLLDQPRAPLSDASCHAAGRCSFAPHSRETYALAENTVDTDAFFAIYGANLNLDEDGNVESILDAGSVLELYYKECEKEGLPRPKVVGAS